MKLTGAVPGYGPAGVWPTRMFMQRLPRGGRPHLRRGHGFPGIQTERARAEPCDGYRAPALTADAPDDRGVNETIMGEVTLDGVASWRKMSKSPSRFPVTVTHLPVTRCQLCRHTVAYRPGAISETLTEHYRRAHPKRLILLSVAP
jgi:hypothetical protein